jgi:DNA-binding LytR/AlgR family response regulator
MKVLIIEDEELAAKKLIRLLKEIDSNMTVNALDGSFMSFPWIFYN